MNQRLLCVLCTLFLLFTLSCTTETATSDTAVTDVAVASTTTADTAPTDTAATNTVGTETVVTETATTENIAPVAEIEPLVIATARNADENLFMVQLLDAYYAELPGSNATREDVQQWLTATRASIGAARRTIASRDLDQDIDTLYENYITFINAYENYLVTVGLIAKRSDGKVVTDLGASAWKGYETAEKLESSLSKAGASKDDASDLGAAGGILWGVLEYAQREQQRKEARGAAIAAQERLLNDTRAEVNKRSQSIVRMLTRRHRWSKGEAGFDDFESKYLSEYVKRRPRDPFLKIRYATTRVEKETAESVMQDAWLAAAATSLVPADRTYQTIRNDYFAEAADLAALAASTQAGDTGYSAHPPMAATALSFARGYLARDSADKTGRGHAALARALAFSGRYREAVENASVAIDRAPDTWRESPTFCFRFASYLSLDKQHLDYVGPWLKKAYANGFTNVALIRKTPDFDNYRRAYPEEYASLTKVKVTYDIVYGILNDDIVLYNQSPFGITNLRVQMTIRKGSRVWTPDLSCRSLDPGESCKAVDAVSIPNDTYDDLTATVACDQCES